MWKTLVTHKVFWFCWWKPQATNLLVELFFLVRSTSETSGWDKGMKKTHIKYFDFCSLSGLPFVHDTVFKCLALVFPPIFLECVQLNTQYNWLNRCEEIIRWIIAVLYFLSCPWFPIKPSPNCKYGMELLRQNRKTMKWISEKGTGPYDTLQVQQGFLCKKS